MGRGSAKGFAFTFEMDNCNLYQGAAAAAVAATTYFHATQPKRSEANPTELTYHYFGKHKQLHKPTHLYHKVQADIDLCQESLPLLIKGTQDTSQGVSLKPEVFPSVQ